MTTLADLQTELSIDYLRDPNNRIRPSNTVVRALQKGYRKLQSDLLFSVGENETSESLVTSTGTSAYNFPTNGQSIEAIVGDNELKYITFDEFVGMGTLAQGKPFAYYVRANKINFVPTPDSAYTYTVYYNQYESDITSTQDTAYPDDYNEAILARAAYLLFTSVQKFENGQAMRIQYNEAVDVLRMKYFMQDNNIYISF